MPKWKDYTGFENEYIRIIGKSDEKIQIEKNKNRKNKTEYWDYQCKTCGSFSSVAKPNIPVIKSCGCSRIHCINNATKEIGKTYNRLTIVGINEERTMQRNSYGNYTTYCFAYCSCSPDIIRSYNLAAIKSGHIKSCGCLKFNNPLIIEDLTGQTFNRLTVVGRDIERDQKERNENGVRSGNAHWLCKCSCGNENLVSVTGYALKSGSTKSCGCLVSETVAARNKADSRKYNNPENYKENNIVTEENYLRVYDSEYKYSFLIDKEDYEYVKQWYWRKSIVGDNPNKWYWVTNEKQENMKKGSKTSLKLHQLVAQRKYGEKYNPNFIPDHLSRDPDDNRRCNIVQKSNLENSHNRKLSKANNSGKTGVYKKKNTERYTASITVNYKTIYLGEYSNFEDAVRARIEAEQKYGFTCDDIKPNYDYIDLKE